MFWKINLEVPAGIRYLTQWEEFQLDRFKGKNILHKQIPGCGMTEYALTCPYPVVLCSPRKMLMENKKDQHGDDVFLVVSKYDKSLDIDSNITKPDPSSVTLKKIKIDENFENQKLLNEENTYSSLFHEIQHYINSLSSRKYPKIIVTYDSSYLVERVLEQMGFLDNFWFIVDEFQSLLEDARFKADVENEFLTILQQIPNVLYVSATPMLDKYIQRIPELNLPYYELDWSHFDKTRIKRPNLKVRTMSSISGKMTEIIQSYLDGKFEKVIVEDKGNLVEVESKEAVFYVNSVNHIINIIKKLNLSPDQVNILCSNTPENQDRINKKLGKEYKIGKVPLKGEPHKMFTFCTRTVYLGADFYSLCARSFIFSDANSDCLSVDISMDLAQILGRQRLEENPWHNSAEFYYRVTCDYKKMTWEDLQKIILRKRESTEKLLNVWSKGDNDEKLELAKQYQYIARSLKYRDHYIAVNKQIDSTGSKNLIPVINNLVIINEERTFDIQQVDYKDRFSVFSSINRELGGGEIESNEVKSFFNIYDSYKTYLEKVVYICEYLIENTYLKDSIINNLVDSDKIKQQLIVLGPERIKGLGYNVTKINKAMGITIFSLEELNDTIYSTFKVGERYTNKFIKETLKSIYLSADYKGTAKANDLENWFTVKSIKISINEKRENGLELLSVKTKYK